LKDGRRISDWVVLILCGSAVAVRPLFSGMSAGLYGNAWVFFIIGAAFVIWCIRQEGKKEAVLPSLSVSLPLLLFLGFSLASFFLALNRYGAILPIFLIASYLLLFFMIYDLSSRLGADRFFLYLILSSALASAIYGVYQYRVVFPVWQEELQKDPENLLRLLGLSPLMLEDLANRIRTREVFSTFSLSNTFAGFLIIIIPVAFAFLVQRMRRRAKFLAAAFVMVIVLLILSGINLYLTRSRLALGAFAVTIAIFVVFSLWKKFPRALKWVTVIVPIVLVASLIFFLHQKPSSGFAKVLYDAANVRLGFWDGAVKVIEEKPLFGVGFGNFAGSYLRLKEVWAHEVTKAHSVYLSIWSQAGIFALLGFASFWAVVLVKCLSGASAEKPQRNEPAPKIFFLLAGGVSCGVSFLMVRHPFFGAFSIAGMTDVLLVAWVMFFAVLFLSEGANRTETSSGRILTLGIAFALICSLIHSGTDIDFSEPGIAQTLFVLAAVGLSLKGNAQGDEKLKHLRLPSIPGGIVLLGLLAFGIGVFVFYPMAKAERLLSSAKRTFFAGDLTGARIIAEKAIRSGRSFAENPEAYGLLGQISAARWREKPLRNWIHFREAASAFSRCLEINPYSFTYPMNLAELYEAGADSVEEYLREGIPSALDRQTLTTLRFYSRGLKERLQKITGERFLKQKGEALSDLPGRLRLLALHFYEEATRLYPTNPIVWKRLGKVRERLGDEEGALLAYRKALKLHPLVGQHHLKLSPEEIEEIKSKIEG